MAKPEIGVPSIMATAVKSALSIILKLLRLYIVAPRIFFLRSQLKPTHHHHHHFAFVVLLLLCFRFGSQSSHAASTHIRLDDSDGHTLVHQLYGRNATIYQRVVYYRETDQPHYF